MCLSIEWKLYTCRNSNRETVEKNSSTIGPPAGIERFEPMPVRCQCTALDHQATEVADGSAATSVA